GPHRGSARGGEAGGSTDRAGTAPAAAPPLLRPGAALVSGAARPRQPGVSHSDGPRPLGPPRGPGPGGGPQRARAAPRGLAHRPAGRGRPARPADLPGSTHAIAAGGPRGAPRLDGGAGGAPPRQSRGTAAVRPGAGSS